MAGGAHIAPPLAYSFQSWSAERTQLRSERHARCVLPHLGGNQPGVELERVVSCTQGQKAGSLAAGRSGRALPAQPPALPRQGQASSYGAGFGGASPRYLPPVEFTAYGYITGRTGS